MPNQLIKQLVFGVILIVVGVFLVVTYFPPNHSENDNEAFNVSENFLQYGDLLLEKVDDNTARTTTTDDKDKKFSVLYSLKDGSIISINGIGCDGKPFKIDYDENGDIILNDKKVSTVPNG